jgi:hypothetical protein
VRVASSVEASAADLAAYRQRDLSDRVALKGAPRQNFVSHGMLDIGFSCSARNRTTADLNALSPTALL